MSDLELLRKERREIAELTRLHAGSVFFFQARGRSWFKLHTSEEDKLDQVRHRTTTASCLESLADSPPRDDDSEVKGEDARTKARQLAHEFGTKALAEADGKWQSEGAAHVYCRVRTLPAILRLAPEIVPKYSNKIARHLRFVWGTISAEPRRQAIYEHTKSSDRKDPNYPPNAFQTFWALLLLDLCKGHPQLAEVADEFRQSREIAVLWTQNMLAAQVSLHYVDSERVDPSQLMWALIAQSTAPKDPEEPAAGEFARKDLYEAGLRAFFEQQTDSGTWPLGQPLFHYPKAGNAYCYTYETLTALLRPALLAESGKLLRELLRPYLPKLIKSWHAARDSQVSLASDGTAVGWRSGHHPHRTDPEGWATASVFSYLQCLRRLIGIWANEDAAAELGARPANYPSPGAAAEELSRRGDTWTGNTRWTAGEEIASLFLHPVAATGPRDEDLDPDLALVRRDQARSAILFGPPGTGKTTLAEALAGVLGWDFVQIHASDFLIGGMDRVSSRADEIFSRLMELDHCVVLFDEIDELLRERQDAESDPFGRFLTTTMLPKVARLWEQRRVLFFVATNDVRHADRAIKRSQRFDAAIFVAPPSYEAKMRFLRDQIPGLELGWFSQKKVEAALDKDPMDDPSGYFALLRWDQLPELVEKLKDNPSDRGLVLHDALKEIGKALAESDWIGAEHHAGSSNRRNAYEAFRYMQQQERRDHGRMRLVSVASPTVSDLPAGLETFLVRDGTTYVKVTNSPTQPPRAIVVGAYRMRRNRLLEYR